MRSFIPAASGRGILTASNKKVIILFSVGVILLFFKNFFYGFLTIGTMLYGLIWFGLFIIFLSTLIEGSFEKNIGKITLGILMLIIIYLMFNFSIYISTSQIPLNFK